MEFKYELRDKKRPYYWEKEIIDGYPVSLKEYEIYDGKNVKWGIKEDYANATDPKIFNTTPLFDNITDRYNHDKKRILYIGKSSCVFTGKLNNSQVLGRINDRTINYNYMTIQDFGGEDVRICEQEDDLVFVTFLKDGLRKCLYFNYKEFKQCGNTFDVAYIDGSFIKSYVVDGTVRPFIGEANFKNEKVKPIGYDLCKQVYTHFPLDENGYIDDDVMMSNLSGEYYNIGYKIKSYNDINKYSLISMLKDMGLDGSIILSELKEKNNEIINKNKCLVK